MGKPKKMTIVSPSRSGRSAALAGGLLAATALATVVSLPSGAHAAGFQIRENSSALLGTAFAGLASDPRDLSTAVNNPAGLTYIQRSGAEAALSLIVPSTKFKGTSSDAIGRPISGEAEGSKDPLPLPAAFLVYAPEGQDWRLALSATAPYGLETDYDDDWTGRYHAVKSTLETANVNLAGAYRLMPQLSVGGGISVQRAEAELTNAVDFGAILANLRVPGFLPQSADGMAKVQGDDWGWGWNLGLLFEPVPGTRFGLSYHSKIDHTLEGTGKFTVPTSVRTVFTAVGVQAFQPESDATADVTTPQSIDFSVSQDLGRLGLHATASWTDWSEFKEIRVVFANPAQPVSVDEQFYNDTWFFAVGATYAYRDDLTLRVGAAHDGRAAQGEYRTPRIPDEERTWLTAGLSWQPLESLTVDAGYAHLFVADATVNQTTGTGNRLTGHFESNVDIISVAARYRF
ncbi:OmpP1/FadL family transporter [Rhodospirillum centenum]|nr:outer membrane protein transport protein [Rhodospirillum centenum]